METSNNNGECWYARWSKLESERCHQPGRWMTGDRSNQIIQNFRWCDAHRHDSDVLAPPVDPETAGTRAFAAAVGMVVK